MTKLEGKGNCSSCKNWSPNGNYILSEILNKIYNIERRNERMKVPECKYEDTEVELAKYEEPDLFIDDHDFMLLGGGFNYLNSGHQGIGITMSLEFIRRFMGVMKKHNLSKCTELCWVEHNDCKIFRIISVDGKKEFDIESYIKK